MEKATGLLQVTYECGRWVYTIDILACRHLCPCAEIETHFRNHQSNEMARQGQAPHPMGTCAHERVSFSDVYSVVLQWSICLFMLEDTKMSLFQPNCSMKNYIPRCFSTTFVSAGPLIARHNTTEQALSTHPYRIVSSLCIPTFMEKVKKWLWNSRTFARAISRVSTHDHVTRSRAGSLQIRLLLEVVWCCANTDKNVLPNNKYFCERRWECTVPLLSRQGDQGGLAFEYRRRHSPLD